MDSEITTTDSQDQHTTIGPAYDPKKDQLILTPKHKQLIRDQIAKGATHEEFDLFMMMAVRTRLDPLLKQLYFIKFKNWGASRDNGCHCKKDEGPCGKEVYDVSYVTSIDGYRIIAHRTGLFAGVDEPKFRYDGQRLIRCTVSVYKKDSDRPFSASVSFSEYNTGKNLWKKMPETMLAKVAEAHALRKAFPQDLSGIYTQDEMDQAEPTIVSNTSSNAEPEQGEVVEEQAEKAMQKDQLSVIVTMMKELNISKANLMRTLSKHFKTVTLKGLTFQQADQLIEIMTEEYMPKAGDSEELDYDEIDEGIENMRQENA